LTRLSLLITSLVCFFIRADNLQRVLLVVGSCHLNPPAAFGARFPDLLQICKLHGLEAYAA
jgi:hypothetical protein